MTGLLLGSMWLGVTLFTFVAQADSILLVSEPVPGNLSDLMRNATIFRATFVAPVVVHVNNPTPDAHVGDTYGPL